MGDPQQRIDPAEAARRGFDEATTRPGPAIEPKDPRPWLTAQSCVDTHGQHEWRRGPYMGGVLGPFAVHHRHCARCPATREGLLNFTDPHSVMRWHYPTGQP